MSYDILDYPLTYNDAFDKISETLLNLASEARHKLTELMVKEGKSYDDWMIKDSISFVDNKISYNCWPVRRPEYLRYYDRK